MSHLKMVPKKQSNQDESFLDRCLLAVEVGIGVGLIIVMLSMIALWFMNKL